MNIYRIHTFIACALVLTSTALAKPKKRKPARPAPQTPQIERQRPGNIEIPSESLSSIVTEMNEVLPFSAPPELKATEKFQSSKIGSILALRLQEIPSEIANLKSLFESRLLAAKPEDQPIYSAGIALCDTITTALNEREKAKAAASPPVSTSPVAKTKWKRKQLQKPASPTDPKLEAAWNKRKDVLLRQIEESYMRLEALEVQKDQRVPKPTAIEKEP